MTALKAEFIPTLRYATERDIDLLLIEEIKASAEFTVYVISRLGYQLNPEQLGNWDCKHSTSRLLNRREIDIRIYAETVDRQRLIGQVTFGKTKFDHGDGGIVQRPEKAMVRQ